MTAEEPVPLSFGFGDDIEVPLENILILMFLGFMFIKTSRLDKQIAFKWLVYLFAALAIYGLVVYNFGTAVRYKFPFIVIVIVGMAYELYLKHGKLILNKSSRAWNLETYLQYSESNFLMTKKHQNTIHLPEFYKGKYNKCVE